MKEKINRLYFILLIILIIKLFISLLVYGSNDVYFWAKCSIAVDLSNNFNLYDIIYINLLPIIPIISYLIYKISILLNIPFHFLIKLPSIISDLIIFKIIFNWSINENKNIDEAISLSLIWLFIPISNMITSIHGQFDPVVICLSLYSTYILKFQPQKYKISAILLGTAITFKTYAIIFLPILLMELKERKKILYYTLLTFIIPFIITLPFFIKTPQAILNNVIGYSSRFGQWGYILLLEIISKNIQLNISYIKDFLIKYGKFITLFVMTIYILWIRNKEINIIKKITILILIFYVFTAGFGLQYLMWIIPFAIISKNKIFFYYSLFSSLWGLCHYIPITSMKFYFLIISFIRENYYWKFATLFSLITWIICIIWLKKEINYEKKILH